MELTELSLLFKVIRMTGKKVHIRFALTLAILLLLLIANVAIAYHHHDLDESSHHDCPVCATAYVTSSAVHDFSTPTVEQTGITFSVLTSHEHDTCINPIFLAYLGNRSPPR
jgi:hypothetical protein